MPLVLSRNKDESIVIGEGENAVTITFLGNKLIHYHYNPEFES